jgi:hypothetical protein
MTWSRSITPQPSVCAIWGESEDPYNILTEDDLRKFALTTSMAILVRLPCLQLGDAAIEEMNSKYYHLLAEKMGAA